MFVYSLESPHRGDSNEYTQHTIISLKIENISISYRHLLPVNLIGSNYPSLEQSSMVPKMLEPFKFDCIVSVLAMFVLHLSFFCASGRMCYVNVAHNIACLCYLVLNSYMHYKNMPIKIYWKFYHQKS